MRFESNSFYRVLSRARIGHIHLGSGQERTISMLLLAVGFTAATCLKAVPAQAQSMRTYVSGKGSDSNTCTASSPCLTLQGALAKTLAGGEIYTLNSANYGHVTISHAISIVAGSGVSGVLAPSNVSGITISAGANDVVNLRGL